MFEEQYSQEEKEFLTTKFGGIYKLLDSSNLDPWEDEDLEEGRNLARKLYKACVAKMASDAGESSSGDCKGSGNGEGSEDGEDVNKGADS